MKGYIEVMTKSILLVTSSKGDNTRVQILVLFKNLDPIPLKGKDMLKTIKDLIYENNELNNHKIYEKYLGRE